MAFPIMGAIGSLTKGATLGALFRGLTAWALKWGGPIIVNILAFIGLSLVTQEFAMGPMISALSNSMAGAPAVFVQVFAYVGGDVAMSMILSAYTVRAAGRLVFRRASP